jgi:hypothetical protein
MTSSTMNIGKIMEVIGDKLHPLYHDDRSVIFMVNVGCP